MSLTTLSRAALLPLTLTLNLNPLVSIAARTSYHQLQSSNLKSSTTISSPFHPQCPSFLHSHSYSTMSTDQTTKNDPTADTNQHQQPDNTTPQNQHQQDQEQLALPDSSSSDAATNQLDLSGGGSTAKLDHLGPMVVNTDGTLARITNWEHMTEGEKQATLRVLGKRNKQRLETLKAARGEGKDEGQS